MNDSSSPDGIEAVTALEPNVGETLDAFVVRKYAELRELARGLVRLDATSLVHTAYRRLANSCGEINGDGQGFSLFSMVMRQALVDRIRAAGAQKRGANAVRVSFDPGCADQPADRPQFEMIGLHEAIERLRLLDPRKWEVTEHKWFGGLTDEQTALALGISRATVERDWKFAKAWLRDELSGH